MLAASLLRKETRIAALTVKQNESNAVNVLR